MTDVEALPPHPPSHDSGHVTLWLLGVAVMILFVAGFAVDLWQATAERRALAGLADAAATAGSAALDDAAFREDDVVRLAPDEAEARAGELLAARVETAEPPITAVTVDATPERVQVVVHGEVEATLLRLLAPRAGTWPVRVQAVAEPRVSPADG